MASGDEIVRGAIEHEQEEASGEWKRARGEMGKGARIEMGKGARNKKPVENL